MCILSFATALQESIFYARCKTSPENAIKFFEVLKIITFCLSIDFPLIFFSAFA